MILVNCVPVTAPASQSADEILTSLLQNPTLISASERLKSTPERNISGSEPVNLIYVFQREYATVDADLVKFVGTDEATTCVGLVIRNRETGMTSISHMDFEGIVDMGLSQMLALLAKHEADTTLDVHLIGGFDDVNDVNGASRYATHKKPNGYSLPLCSKIIKSLQNRKENFHLKTLCVLGHNTKVNSEGIPLPVITGFLVETSSGIVVPASFDNTSRGPDELVRRVRISVSFRDPYWKGKLLDTYDTHLDKFHIAPCSWADWRSYALYMLQLPDSKFLWQGSTSPHAESPDFVENEKRKWKYLFDHPDWRFTFEDGKPLIFERAPNGQWKRSS